jgi:hypothetical protein
MINFKFIRGYPTEEEWIHVARFDVGLLDYSTFSGLTVTNITSERGVILYERCVNGEHFDSVHLVNWCQNPLQYIPPNRKLRYLGTMADFMDNFRRMEVPTICTIKPYNNFMVYSHLQKPDYNFTIREMLEIIYIQ